MKNLLIIISVFLVAGAAYILLWPGNVPPAPEAGKHAPAPHGASDEPQNPFLANADAQTPYFFANLNKGGFTPFQDDSALDDMLNQQTPELRDALQADEDVDPAMKILLKISENLPQGEAVDKAGLLPEPFYALHSVRLMPYAHLELASGRLFDDWLTKTLTKEKLSWQTKTIAGEAYIWVPAEEGFGLGVYIQDKELSAAFIPENDAYLKRLVGHTGPDIPYSERMFETFNKQAGYLGIGSGYLDWSRLYAELGNLPPALADVLQKNAPDMYTISQNRVCLDEYAAIARSMPRLTFGYTRADAEKIEMRARQELDPAWAMFLAPVAQTEMSQVRPVGESVISVGVGLDLQALKKVLGRVVSHWLSTPPQCPSLAQVFANAQMASGFLSQPMANMIMSNLNGIYTEVGPFEKKADGGTKVNGTVSVFADNPKKLLGMIQKFSGQADLSSMAPGDAPRLVSQGKESGGGQKLSNPGLALTGLGQYRLWVALADKAVGVAVGDALVSSLPETLRRIKPDAYILNVQMNYSHFAEAMTSSQALFDKAAEEARKKGQSPEAVEQIRRTYESQQEVYKYIVNQAEYGTFGVAFTRKGIEFIASMNLKP